MKTIILALLGSSLFCKSIYFDAGCEGKPLRGQWVYEAGMVLGTRLFRRGEPAPAEIWTQASDSQRQLAAGHG